MNPKPIAKAVLYALAEMRIGHRARFLGTFHHVRFGLVLA